MTARISNSDYGKMTGKKLRAGYHNHYARKVDANQSDLVDTFRKFGFMVQPLHGVGGGVTDIAIGKYGLTIWVEIKDGVKVPSAREYTPAQKRWHFAWAPAVMRCVAICKADCIRINEQVNAIAAQMKAAGIVLQVTGSKERQYAPALYS